MKRTTPLFFEIAGLTIPPVGVYDVPDAAPFHPIAEPAQCVFGSLDSWCNGESTVIGPGTASSFGCPGAGYWLCGIEAMPRADVAGYLAGKERLKASEEIMCQWLEQHPPYQMEYEAVIISQLKADQYEYLKTVTFFINADQLALFLTGAEYLNAAPDRCCVVSPFGSGCGQLVSMFQKLDEPMAMIGATDIAMRKYLPQDTLTFTVTKPMLEHLSGLGDDSFLTRSFWKEVQEARNT